MINPIKTMADNPMMICLEKFSIEQYSPMCMEQFSVAMHEKTVARCVFTCVLCYKVLKCIKELFVYLGSSQTA